MEFLILYMDKKTLFIILAETRASELTKNFFLKNILNGINNIDLALCVGLNKNTLKPNFFYDNAKYIWEIDENLNTLDELYDMIALKEKSCYNWRDVLQCNNSRSIFGGLNRITQTSAGYLYLYRWLLLQKINKVILSIYNVYC